MTVEELYNLCKKNNLEKKFWKKNNLRKNFGKKYFLEKKM